MTGQPKDPTREYGKWGGQRERAGRPKSDEVLIRMSIGFTQTNYSWLKVESERLGKPMSVIVNDLLARVSHAG